MKRLIIIDHSIIDAGGHHLEYADRLLRDAKQNGIKTILASNVQSKGITLNSTDQIEPIFTKTFWEINATDPTLDSKFRILRNIINQNYQEIISRYKKKLATNDIALLLRLYASGKNTTQIILDYRTTRGAGSFTTAEILLAAILYKLSTNYQLFNIKRSKIFKILLLPFKLFFTFLKNILLLFLVPVKIGFTLAKVSRIKNEYKNKADIFTNDLLELHKRVKFNARDVIFVPTLGETELIGISNFNRKMPDLNLQWRLLFRRNPLLGREPNYKRIFQNIHTLNPIELDYYNKYTRTLVALNEFSQEKSNKNCKFFTDTEPLTEQWNSFGNISFNTFPIPHVDNFTKSSRSAEGHLIISYLGDARDEKGFYLLPDLVRKVREMGFDKNKASFRFQSNFNVPLGEPNSRFAKAQLSTMKSEGVTLIEGPFASERYASELLKSDIILTPYDDLNYYARSSGLFAEALVAGIPVIFPKMTWMGREVLAANNKYLSDIQDNLQPINAINLLDIRDNDRYHQVNITKPTSIMVFGSTHAQLPGRYLKICLEKVRSDGSTKTLDGAAIILDLRLKTVFGSCKIKEKGKLRVSFKFLDGSNFHTPLSKSLFNFKKLTLKLGTLDNLTGNQAIGYGYFNTADLAFGLADVIQNYRHYRQRSELFAKHYSKYHSTHNALDTLFETGSDNYENK